jgi:hypothetical protein
MPDITNSAIDKQVYAVNTKGNLLAKVEKVFVCLSAKSLQVAGFDDNGKILTIRCYQSDGSADFFERQFGNEPLLLYGGKVSHVFLPSPKNMLVPKSFYKEDISRQWFHSMQYAGKEEWVYDYSLGSDKAEYMYSVSSSDKELIQRYFPKAKIVPFAAHQFNKNYKTSHILQCSFTSDEAYLTLYVNKNLHWHKVIGYSNIEDVAYEISLVCQQWNIEKDQLAMICAAENNILTATIHKLYEYFPNLTIGTGNIDAEDARWKAPVYLFQQLYLCV